MQNKKAVKIAIGSIITAFLLPIFAFGQATGMVTVTSFPNSITGSSYTDTRYIVFTDGCYGKTLGDGSQINGFNAIYQGGNAGNGVGGTRWGVPMEVFKSAGTYATHSNWTLNCLDTNNAIVETGTFTVNTNTGELTNVFFGPVLSVATSSLAYFSGQTASTTLQQLQNQCSDAGNIFSEGLCMAGTFLFIPNAQILANYAGLPTVLGNKFPFSYITSITTTWQGLVASSTANSPTYNINLADLGIGSTTAMGNILPDFTALSASTTKQYFPAGTFDLLKNLAGIAIILTLMADIFFTSRNLITS